MAYMTNKEKETIGKMGNAFDKLKLDYNKLTPKEKATLDFGGFLFKFLRRELGW